MSARQKMTMRATVVRDVTTTSDPDGQPDVPNFDPLYESLPCLWWVTSEREVMDTNKIAVVGQMKMLVPKGTDITEKDQIAVVKDRLGAVIRPGPMVIENVIPRRTHLELLLEDAA